MVNAIGEDCGSPSSAFVLKLDTINKWTEFELSDRKFLSQLDVIQIYFTFN